MSIMKKIIILLFAFFISASLSVSAENEEWFAKDYDFSNVKTILILPINFDQTVSDISEKNISEFTVQKLHSQNYKILYFNDIINIGKSNKIDLSKKSRQESLSILSNIIANNADAILQINIDGYGMSSEYVSGSTFSYQTTNTSTVSTGTSIATITTPKTNYVHTSGGNVPVAFSHVHFKVFNPRNGQIIYERKDYRDRANKGRLHNTTPQDLYSRILNSFFDRFSELSHKDQ